MRRSPFCSTAQICGLMALVRKCIGSVLAKCAGNVCMRKGEDSREVVACDECQRILSDNYHSKMGQEADRLRGSTANLRLTRKHDKIDYHTQLISGHRIFVTYLHRIGKARFPDCVFYNGVMNDADHTFFLWKVGWNSPVALRRHRGVLFGQRCQRDAE